MSDGAFVLSLLACRAHDLLQQVPQGGSSLPLPCGKSTCKPVSATLNPPSWAQMVKKRQISAENNVFMLCEITSGKEIEAEDKRLSCSVHPCLVCDGAF